MQHGGCAAASRLTRMPNLDIVDRSASVFCLGLLSLLFIVVPLLGVGEDRIHVRLSATTLLESSKARLYGAAALSNDQGDSLRVAASSSNSMAAPQPKVAAAAAAPAVGRVAAATSAATTAASGTTYACVDFVCVARNTATPNLFEYSPSAIAKFSVHATFAGCVEHCVASQQPSAGPATAAAAAAAAPRAAAAGGLATVAKGPAPSASSSLSSSSSSSSSSSLPPTTTPKPPKRLQQGLVHVGNASLDEALARWLALRHDKPRQACTASTPVYFAPFSPNGIGNKLMAIVMAFHMAIMNQRRLVVSLPAKSYLPSPTCQVLPAKSYLPSPCQVLPAKSYLPSTA